MADMLRTLGSPYRQTFSGGHGGSLDVQLRGMVDNLISRVIGFLVRSVLLVAGSLCCAAVMLLGLASLALWGFVPLLPLVGLGLTLAGWTL